MKNALLLVDPQKIYTDKTSEMYCKDANKTIEKMNNLSEYFEKKKLPIFLIRHIHKNDGSDLGRMFDYTGEFEGFNFKEGSDEVEFDENLKIPKGTQIITKNRYSAFINTDLNNELKKLDIKKVTICGFMTNFCCESTARDAHDYDYFVDFISDATGTPGTEDYSQAELRKIIPNLLAEGFAVIKSTKEFLKD